MSRLTRRSLAVGLGLGLALVAIELILQVGALVLWQRREAAETTAGTRGDVLCVGDSFTYGLGATVPAIQSYPRQAAALLVRGGRRCEVINGGWPGQTSRDVRLRLPDQLRRTRPRVVYVLVGYNDSWALPPRVADDDAGDGERPGFSWRWRTGQLLSMAVHALTAGPAEVTETTHAFVGTWHTRQGLAIRFGPDGSFSGPVNAEWSSENGRLFLQIENGDSMPLDWHLEGGQLWLQCPLWLGPMAFEPGEVAPAARRVEAGWTALGAGKLAEATQLLTASLGDPRTEARAREGLALATRDPTARAAQLTALRRLAEGSSDPQATSAAIRAHVSAGDRERALALACRALERDPQRFDEWNVLTQLCAHTGRRPQLAAALRAALDATPRTARATRARLLNTLYVLERDADPAGSLPVLVELALLRPEAAQQLGEHLRTFCKRLPGDALTRAATAAGATAEQRRWLERVVSADASSCGAVLAAHLRQIVRLCRRAGAEPVLLDYPRPRVPVDAAVLRVRDELGVTVLPTREAFDEALQTTPRSSLFARDGHCNERGYAIIAALVAGDAGPRLRH